MTPAELQPVPRRAREDARASARVGPGGGRPLDRHIRQRGRHSPRSRADVRRLSWLESCVWLTCLSLYFVFLSQCRITLDLVTEESGIARYPSLLLCQGVHLRPPLLKGLGHACHLRSNHKRVFTEEAKRLIAEKAGPPL